jgi:hypothetical protein
VGLAIFIRVVLVPFPVLAPFPWDSPSGGWEAQQAQRRRKTGGKSRHADRHPRRRRADPRTS